MKLARETSTEQSIRFSVHADGSFVGSDGSDGELARMVLYVTRGLTQVNALLGVGELDAVHAEGVERELDLAVTLDPDDGLRVRAHLATTGRTPVAPGDVESLVPPGTGLDYVLDVVADVELVAGCFLISRQGQLVAEKVPGVPSESLSNAGRRMKVAHDAFAQLMGATSVRATFEWGCLLTAPVANGIVVAIVDLSCNPAEVLQAAHVGGLPLKGVDLDAHEPVGGLGQPVT